MEGAKMYRFRIDNNRWVIAESISDVEKLLSAMSIEWDEVECLWEVYNENHIG
jgi:hypothetical protein